LSREYEPLQGILPKEYGIFEPTVLDDLVRIFNREILNNISGDVFGRINEYFLMQFAMLEAQDGGEFFTPPSLVQTIVNVIEPEHGVVLDPACGSGGMFVQTDHFIQSMGQDTAKRVVFYGQEAKTMNLKLGKMNLAVHALEGDIREANTLYQDEHSLIGKCDFVMANPPFNVDMVDAERIKGDSRLPFGLPGINKEKKVSNANYLWISYFWSYLNDKGRAGFVMSSQASSAGNSEREVRRKLVETGDVDAMIAIRPNFFYTRTVPCELWFLDRNKPADKKDKVLMIDARGIYRKVNRRVYDFSPEQMANISAIFWLYRGHRDKFLNLVAHYLAQTCKESIMIKGKIDELNNGLDAIINDLDSFKSRAETKDERGLAKAFIHCMDEVMTIRGPYLEDCQRLISEIKSYNDVYSITIPKNNEGQHEARHAFEPIAERVRGLIKQIDLHYKLLDKCVEAAADLSQQSGEIFDSRGLNRQIKKIGEIRKATNEQLMQVVYVYKQTVWLHDKFPDAKLCDVLGLLKLVSQQEMESADWNLSPGRYVGVAPPEVDDDFDFQQAIEEIHQEVQELNELASKLAAKIMNNFLELGL